MPSSACNRLLEKEPVEINLYICKTRRIPAVFPGYLTEIRSLQFLHHALEIGLEHLVYGLFFYSAVAENQVPYRLLGHLFSLEPQDQFDVENVKLVKQKPLVQPAFVRKVAQL